MPKKILRILTNNIGFKILALVLAIVLWIVVYMINDPTLTRTYTTSVTLTNMDSVTDLNKTFEVEDNTVTFRVSAARSYLDRLESANFSATADMSNLVVSEDQTTGTVPISITSDLYNRYLTYVSTQYLTVSLDDLMSKQYVVAASAIGDVADGYALGAVTVENPNVLTVSGPSSLIGQIDRVVALLNVEGMSTDISNNVVPMLYDEDGTEVDPTRLTFSSNTVTVAASIVPIKEVAVTFTPDGTPAEGSVVTEISLSEETIEIKGIASLLNGISSIEIPGDVLSIEGVTEEVSTSVDISEYLPDGVELVDENNRTVTIVVTVEGNISKQVTIPAENIEITGIPAGLEAQLSQTSVVVSITGLANVINGLSGEDLTGTVDVSGLDVGSHKVPFDVTPSEDYTATEKEVTVVLTDPSADTP